MGDLAENGRTHSPRSGLARGAPANARGVMVRGSVTLKDFKSSNMS